MYSSLATLDRAMPEHCHPAGGFLTHFSEIFQSCVPTPLAFISTALGCLSIASWLFAQVPQIYKNWRLQSTSGLSIYFLVEWLLGDMTNLLGCIFTGQATWQSVLAMYYCTVDVVLCVQWLWYEQLKHGRPWRKARLPQDQPSRSPHRRDEQADRSEMTRSASKPIQLPSVGMFRMPRFSFSPSSPSKGGEGEGTETSSGRGITRTGQSGSFMGVSPRTVLYTTTIVTILAHTASASPMHADPQSVSLLTRRSEGPLQIAGRLLSWCSTVLYLGSRLPQLYKNHTRKSTSGLSPHLFVAAFFGNLFYSSSILTNPSAWSDMPPYGGRGWADATGSKQTVWISKAIPFWLGAAGVLIMDAAVGIQFLMYREDAPGPAKSVIVVDEEADDGRHARRQWRRASGWMRGWYPSSVSVAGTPRPGTPRSVRSADSADGDEPGGRRETSLGQEVARWEERQRLLNAGETAEGPSYGSL